ncbi:hypothetical protein [Candidatus Methylobacter oryzae]|uniref:Phage abortive infection protein n=1 Tax=Candidatus Methylobacter oryzae TaxID=2497749 RepID=A0ABY3CEH2_9GAMM|nr:hypothetical protein [Candidatus Methylobacter oryzae]TRX01164.1 hypothetical protein EKO24_004350 [Candidatus Methylobacter oryzae]
MIDRYIVAAAIAIFTVAISYIVNFFFKLNYTISNDPAVWGQLGDYFGGLLNPTLSFMSLVLLIKSLRLQNEANESLRRELKNSEKTEKIRSFETLFFNMINSQKSSFDSFKIEVNTKAPDVFIYGIEAVIKIEDEIKELRQQCQDDKLISKFLEDIDLNDQIFSLTRCFYIIVRMITEKLSDDNGFSEEDRKSHLLALVNFTDFSLLRLIMISMQFMKYQSTEYLRNNNDFNAVLDEVSLSYSLY